MAVSAARNAKRRRYLENRHIDHIPAGARHGKVWHQFAFWFGGNINVFNVVLGAITVSIGLTFWQALIAIAAGTLGPVAAIGRVSGSWALVIMAVSLIDSNTVNAYTGSFQILAFGSMWRRFKAESVTVRLGPLVCVMAAGVVTAYLGYRSFVTNLTNFLDVLLVILIPWSAVNLADYFLVRRGSYDVASFFTADGAYGRFAWRGLLAYTVGIAAEWPFVAQPDYTGPLVRTLGGADISWLVGWFAAAIAYLLLVALTPGTDRHDRQLAVTAYSPATPPGPASGGPVSD
jgi:purine-cytosine permease-like protein